MIAVIDYGIGNLFSCYKALIKAGGEAELVQSPDQLEEASAVVLPGVGDFGAAMAALRARGFAEPFVDAVRRGVPTLGVCVGLQMLFEGSEESPGIPGLALLPGVVRRLRGEDRLPQMQWNTLHFTDARHHENEHDASALFRGLRDETWVYFVHSYAAPVGPWTTATTTYGEPFSAAIAQGNLHGTQFHPEKSSHAGLAMLHNFVEYQARIHTGGVA